MAFLDWKNFNYLFHALCLVATIGSQIYCIHKYILNEDATVVGYRRFHTERDDIYPSISFCILNPFLESALAKYGDDINVTSYSNFLRGLTWDERMMTINFDNVTVSLTDNLKWMAVQLHNDTFYFFDNVENNNFPPEWNPSNFYVSFRSSARKCFSFDIPFMEKELVYILYVSIKSTIFPKGVRPVYGSSRDDMDGFITYLHYPGQWFTSYYTNMYDWKARVNNTNNYYMKFDAKDVEVLRYRNRHKERCIEDWRNYDEVIANAIIAEVGCRPPHWNTTSDLAMCTNPEEMKHFKDEPTTAKVQSFDPPCNVIERIQYNYFEDDYPNTNEGNKA